MGTVSWFKINILWGTFKVRFTVNIWLAMFILDHFVVTFGDGSFFEYGISSWIDGVFYSTAILLNYRQFVILFLGDVCKTGWTKMRCSIFCNIHIMGNLGWKRMSLFVCFGWFEGIIFIHTFRTIKFFPFICHV